MTDEDWVFADDDPLGEARAWLRKQAAAKGAKCPCCRQLAKIYRRAINSGQARILLDWWARCGTAPVKLTDAVRTPGGDYAKLRWWGLIEDMRDRREDGGSAGVWRVTDLGARFARDQTRIPRHVYVYDNRLLRVDHDGETVSIREALGGRFDYDAMMRAAGEPEGL